MSALTVIAFCVALTNMVVTVMIIKTAIAIERDSY